jgi:PAS domain S-box-containing protein
MTTVWNLSSEQRFGLLAEHALDHGMIIFDLDGRIVDWSAGAERLLGWAAEEMIGRPESLIFIPEDRLAGLPEEDTAKAWRDRSAAYARWHVRKDGSLFFGSGVVNPIFGPEKNIIGFGKILRDITRRRLAEDVAARQASLLDLAYEAVFSWELGGIITYWNQAARELYGFTAEEAIGQSSHALLATEFPQNVESIKDTLRLTGRWEGNIVHTDKRGNRLLVESRLVLRSDLGDGPVVLETNRDITTQRQAEETLQTSEQRFRSLVMATAKIIWTTTPDGRTVEDSPSWRAFTGQSYDAYKDTGWLDAVHPDDRDATLRAWTECLATQCIFETEYRLRRADGLYRWTTVRGVPIINAGGSVREWIGANTDVTETRNAAEALRFSEERLHFALEVSAMVAWDWSFATGESTRTGISKSLLGLGSGAVDGFIELIHPGDRERVLDSIERAKRGEQAHDCEYRVNTPKGLVWLADKARLRTDPSDGQQHLVGVCMDVTRKKRAEERLELLDAINEGIRAAVNPEAIMAATTGLLGRHLCATRCAYADLEDGHDAFTIRHDWTTESTASTVGNYSLDLFGQHAATCLRNGRTLVIYDVDRELAPTEGAAMFQAIGIKAIITCPLVKDGRLVALMAVHQSTPRDWRPDDVSLVEEIAERSWAHIERVRAAAALREADRRKTEFLATLAHELRNPLAPIRNGLQIIRRKADDPATVAHVRDMMERQLTQMVHLVDDLLDIARITRGQIELQKEKVALKDVVASAVESNVPLIEASRHALTVDIPDALPLLDLDPTRIAQVLSNFLNNAVKYTPSGGRIALSAKQDRDEVVISVTDTGIGIPAESLTSVFEMFSRVEQNMSRAQGGLGIGLSLVRQLVELHDGTVTVDSPGAGLGSTFTVRLPLSLNGSEAIDVVPIASEPARETARPFRILVVDDNTDAAETTSAVLDMLGHETEVANDGNEALQKAQAFLPDVIFLDIGLPGMDGYEVARRLRRIPEVAHVTLVALTGWGGEDDLVQSKNAGFDQHLTKPVKLSTFEHLLSELARA